MVEDDSKAPQTPLERAAGLVQHFLADMQAGNHAAVSRLVNALPMDDALAVKAIMGWKEGQLLRDAEAIKERLSKVEATATDPDERALEEAAIRERIDAILREMIESDDPLSD